MKIKSIILWRITMVLTITAVIFDFRYTFFVRNPYDPIIILCVPVYFGLLSFWGILWAITPSKWWDWKI